MRQGELPMAAVAGPSSWGPTWLMSAKEAMREWAAGPRQLSMACMGPDVHSLDM